MQSERAGITTAGLNGLPRGFRSRFGRTETRMSYWNGLTQNSWVSLTLSENLTIIDDDNDDDNDGDEDGVMMNGLSRVSHTK